MEGRKKTYKPGQLITIRRHVYRILRGSCKECPFKSNDVFLCVDCVFKIYANRIHLDTPADYMLKLVK